MEKRAGYPTRFLIELPKLQQILSSHAAGTDFGRYRASWLPLRPPVVLSEP